MNKITEKGNILKKEFYANHKNLELPEIKPKEPIKVKINLKKFL